MILPYWVWPSTHLQKCLFLDFLFPRNKQRVSYLTNHNVRFYYAIFFAFVAVIMVTSFCGKSECKNKQFCDAADGRMYLTITLLKLHIDKIDIKVTTLTSLTRKNDKLKMSFKAVLAFQSSNSNKVRHQ